VTPNPPIADTIPPKRMELAVASPGLARPDIPTGELTLKIEASH